MLQATAMRMAGFPGVTAPIVVCGAVQVEVIGEQLAEVGCLPMITVAEPVGRNTAPAIAAAALVAPDESVLAVLPADHIVSDLTSFRDAMLSAVDAALEGHLVTFGVAPTRAEAGYGYIRAEGDDEVRRIEEFTEKPDRETAARLVQADNWFWNSGMFVFRPDVVLDEMRRVAPGIIDAVQRSLGPAVGGVIEPGPTFEQALSVAFDVAVMEKTDKAVMVPLDAGWNDIGSWRSLWEASGRDVDENVVVGEGIVHKTHRSYVRAGDRPVVVLGLDDVAVVDAGDVVFVASMKHAQDVKELVARLEQERPDLT